MESKSKKKLSNQKFSKDVCTANTKIQSHIWGRFDTKGETKYKSKCTYTSTFQGLHTLVHIFYRRRGNERTRGTAKKINLKTDTVVTNSEKIKYILFFIIFHISRYCYYVFTILPWQQAERTWYSYPYHAHHRSNHHHDLLGHCHRHHHVHRLCRFFLLHLFLHYYHGSRYYH